MKTEKSPPLHLTEAFFVLPFSFSNKHRRELNARGISEDVVAELERALAEPKSYYESGQAPRRRGRRKTLQVLHDAFAECASRLEKTDKSILDVLNAEGLSKTGVSVLGLWDLIIKYGEAAQKAANGIPPVKSGPDARKDTHVAAIVGETLERSGISLDNSSVGKFVISTGIVFEAIGIHKKIDARNAVRRALKIIAKS